MYATWGFDCDSKEQSYLPERMIATTFPKIAAGSFTPMDQGISGSIGDC